MVIERQNNEIIIRPNGSVNMDAVQKLIDYINVLEIVSENKGTEEEAAELADGIERAWWNDNKHRFLQ